MMTHRRVNSGASLHQGRAMEPWLALQPWRVADLAAGLRVGVRVGIGGLVWAILLGVAPLAHANGPCGGSVRSPETACCEGQAVQSSLPEVSTHLAQDICHVLGMPTTSRSEGEAFRSQVQPGSLLTHTSVSAETMTLPSLWWTRDSIPPQLGRHRLVDSWVSYTMQGSNLRVVDVMINGQFWRALTMPQRYGVLNQFGHAAQEFGYYLRFFQNSGYSARLMGIYACEMEGNAASDAEWLHRAPCFVSVDTTRVLQLQQAMRIQPLTQTAMEWSPPAEAPTLPPVDLAGAAKAPAFEVNPGLPSSDTFFQLARNTESEFHSPVPQKVDP